MTAASQPVRLFIGSSSEGRDVARSLQAELGGACDVVRWDQGVFEPGGYTLDSLIDTAAKVDFAVLVATPDDTTVSRAEERPSPRDNIVLEFGLFAGALGRDRTYLLATGDLKLPTDVLGLTRLPYHHQSNTRAAVSAAAVLIEERMDRLRPLRRRSGASEGSPHASLDQELDLLIANAVSQGWTVRTNSPTTLRLQPPRGRTHTLTKSRPETTRAELRRFAAEVRSAGLRVNNSIRRPVDESPF
ncbi:nucleotide-binding protein [Georgenia alba]|uniref:Nucleotide-binding protein n=1 Tax=Georgenia alba TaxID=2233858 RepID=A0ABW2QA60_9MICO